MRPVGARYHRGSGIGGVVLLCCVKMQLFLSLSLALASCI